MLYSKKRVPIRPGIRESSFTVGIGLCILKSSTGIRSTVGKAVKAMGVQVINQRLAEFSKKLTVSQRVLIVDDDVAIQKMFETLLTARNIQTTTTDSAEYAQAIIKGGDIAVVLLDKNLPGMSGIQLLQKIKASWPKIEVLMITAHACVDSALEAISLGAFDYIPKPMPSLNYLVEKTNGALARHDFEVRVNAMIGFLSSTIQDVLKEQESGEQAEVAMRLKELLVAHHQPEKEGHVLFVGPMRLSNLIEGKEMWVESMESLAEAERILKQSGKETHVVVYVEQPGSTPTAEAIKRIHSIAPDVGVFVIANDQDLKQVVQAIGIGVGDYLVNTLESRDLFEPRIKRLVTRQQRVARYRNLIVSLKTLNVDILDKL